MRVLLSIKPQFADLIFSGDKGYEFRKVLFKNTAVKTIVVYASSPVQKVIGEFDIDKTLSMEPLALWKATSKKAGISKDYFMEYFEDRNRGHAIKVGSKRRYDKPKSLQQEFGISTPPQSFMYLPEEICR